MTFHTMHTTKRQWIRILLLAVLTILCCNSSVLAADTTHYADADRHESHSHVAAPDTGKDNATVATLHETARVCSPSPTRNSSVSKPSPTQRVHFRNQNLFNLQKICFAGYRGSGSILSRPIMPLPPCDYYVFTLRRLLC